MGDPLRKLRQAYERIEPWDPRQAGAYKHQCKSVFRAPMASNPDVVADHQCSNSDKCGGGHYDGTGYEWDDAIGAISRKPPAEITDDEWSKIHELVERVRY